MARGAAHRGGGRAPAPLAPRPLDAGHDHARARALAQARIAELDVRIAELEAARNALRRLAKQCGAARDGPCPILAAFDG